MRNLVQKDFEHNIISGTRLLSVVVGENHTRRKKKLLFIGSKFWDFMFILKRKKV